MFVLGGVAPGETATLQVRVWDSSKFSSFADAWAGGGEVGASGAFNYTVPLAGSTPDKYYMDNLRAFVINIPEPSTWAFLVLVVSGIWYARVKRAS
jgi:hypothetical protein